VHWLRRRLVRAAFPPCYQRRLGLPWPAASDAHTSHTAAREEFVNLGVEVGAVLKDLAAVEGNHLGLGGNVLRVPCGGPMGPFGRHVHSLHVDEPNVHELSYIGGHRGHARGLDEIHKGSTLGGGGRGHGSKVIDHEGATRADAGQDARVERPPIGNMQVDEQRHEVIELPMEPKGLRQLQRVHAGGIGIYEAHEFIYAAATRCKTGRCLIKIALKLNAHNRAAGRGGEVPSGPTDTAADVEKCRARPQAQQLSHLVARLRPQVVVLVEVAQGGQVAHFERAHGLAYPIESFLHRAHAPVIHRARCHRQLRWS
jgi:hypothetical protein